MNKRIYLIVAAGLMLLAGCGTKKNTDKDMNVLSFNEKQAAAMTVIACHEARGDQSSLAIAIGEGFDAGLTANQMKEALSQLYAYTGFPRSLNALGTLKKVMEQRGDVEIGAEWFPAYNEGSHYFTIPMQWHLSLHHAIEGWTRDTTMQQLCDLRETPFKDFSGTIIYTAHFHLDSITDDTIQDVTYTPESLEEIDLGQVYDICELTINGTPCGTRWYGERIYDNIGGLLHPGDNTIVIKVTTTLNNYVHTLTEDKVIQHYVHKRNVPTTPAGLVGIDGQIAFF